MPVPSFYRREDADRLRGLGFPAVLLPVFQHFLLAPLALGFGIGFVVGHPATGLVVGLVIGSIYAGLITLLIRRALAEGIAMSPPTGGWRKWNDEDDWDS